MKLLISTDTSCSINKEYFAPYDISLFPLNVIIDGEEFLDGVTINQEQLKDAMKANKNIKTSTPPLGVIIEYFENLFKKGYEHIIHFTISSKLSSMYSLFATVAEQNFKGKLTVIDSYTFSVPMLSYVFLAYDEAQKGTSPEDIVKLVEEAKPKTRMLFIPENLTALKKGGRISPAIALIGNTLGLTPIINLEDGQLEKGEMTRKIRKSLIEKVDSYLPEFPIEEYDYSLVSFFAKERVYDHVYEYVYNKLNGYEMIKGGIPINLCAHCGPGTISLAVTPKINGKSLNTFLTVK